MHVTKHNVNITNPWWKKCHYQGEENVVFDFDVIYVITHDRFWIEYFSDCVDLLRQFLYLQTELKYNSTVSSDDTATLSNTLLAALFQ